jgi:hypothetical protein
LIPLGLTGSSLGAGGFLQLHLGHHGHRLRDGTLPAVNFFLKSEIVLIKNDYFTP